MIVAATGVATIEWNVITREVRASPQWAALTGHLPADFEGKKIDAALANVHPEDRARILEACTATSARGSDEMDIEFRKRHRDGHWIWVLSRARVFSRTADGRPEWIFASQLDITARKQMEERLKRSEKLLNKTGEVAGIGGWELDLRTGVLDWTAETARIHGLPEGQVPVLADAIGLYAPPSQPLIRTAIETAIATGQSYDLQLQLVRADGTTIWVRAVGFAEREAGEVVALFGAFQNIDTQVRQSEALLAEHHRAELASDGSGIGIWEYDLESRKLIWDARIFRLFGRFEAPESLDAELVWAESLHPDERGRIDAEVAAAIAGGRRFDSEFRIIWPDGSEHHIRALAEVVKIGHSGRQVLLGVDWDVTRLRNLTVAERRLGEEMAYRATHDVLTGTTCRPEFERRLQELLSQTREGTHALLFIDLDQFKLVNDSCGHAAGDHVLQQVAQMLSDWVHPGDTLARIGGDEFALLLEDCSLSGAEAIGQEICDRMARYAYVQEEKRLRVGASIGVFLLDARCLSGEVALLAADAACLAAKEAGRNRVRVWQEVDGALLHRREAVNWVSRIERALDEDGFELFAQEIVPLTGRAAGRRGEFLLRLRDRGAGWIPPGDFLPAAERFDLIGRIDRWVLRRALTLLAPLKGCRDLALMAVNLSGRSLGDQAFHQFALEALTACGSEICAKLDIEITETSVVANLPAAARFIEQLHGLGVRVSLDDFGAGAASFGYLRALRVDSLKIDGQFVQTLSSDPLSRAAVRCFVDVARVLGVPTIAEYVDRPELMAMLRDMGVDFAQGFLFGKPQPFDAFLAARDAAS